MKKIKKIKTFTHKKYFYTRLLKKIYNKIIKMIPNARK